MEIVHRCNPWVADEWATVYMINLKYFASIDSFVLEDMVYTKDIAILSYMSYGYALVILYDCSHILCHLDRVWLSE